MARHEKSARRMGLCVALLAQDVLPSLIRLAGVAQPGRAADL